MLTSSANENLIHRSCTFYGTLYALKEICKVGYAGGIAGSGPGWCELRRGELLWVRRHACTLSAAVQGAY